LPATSAAPLSEAASAAEAQDSPRVRLALADYLTLGNALCGFMAVWQLASAQAAQVASGTPGPLDRGAIAIAVVLLLAAAACDLFDGRVARKLGGSGMGAELDNLADVISFGFAPAFFVVAWGTFAADGGPLPIAAAAAVLLAVVVRLARFSCETPGTTSFTGLPSPFGAMAVITIVLLNPPVLLGTAAVFFVAWLMVSRIVYPKPRGRIAFAVLAWILGSVGCLAAWAMDAPAGNTLLYSGSSLVLVLILAIPFYVFAMRRQSGRGGPEEPLPAPREG